MKDLNGHDDEAILSRIRSLFEVADPMPPDLVDQVKFTLTLTGLEAEVAELTSVAGGQLAGAARGSPEEIRTITFDSHALTIMIRIDSNADGTARVDGWLAPPSRCRVEIAIAGEPVTADADEDGRFAFPSVPRGTVRFVVRPPDQNGEQHSTRTKTVITPALVLLTPS
jgi:hypothetical protein